MKKDGGGSSPITFNSIEEITSSDFTMNETILSETETQTDIVFNIPFAGIFNFTVSVPSGYAGYLVKISITDDTDSVPIFTAVNVNTVTVGLYNINTFIGTTQKIRIYIKSSDTANKSVYYDIDPMGDPNLTSKFFITDMYRVC